MTIHELKAIADALAPLPTERVNVRVDGAAAPFFVPAPALMRILRRVEFRMHGPLRWLYWYWITEQPTSDEDLNGMDCGWSGRRLEVE